MERQPQDGKCYVITLINYILTLELPGQSIVCRRIVRMQITDALAAV